MKRIHTLPMIQAILAAILFGASAPLSKILLADVPPVLMAGPCSVESEARIQTLAAQAAEAGATFLRGGAFKPRTSPYSFQGHKEDGLKRLAVAREETGLAIVTEVIGVESLSQALEVLRG